MVKHRGFTLIELMIVVAIIAVVAAIAIPSLLRSRMAANETAAIAACRAFITAEETYHRNDWNQDGVLEYARMLSGNNSLFETTAGAGDVAMIDRAFAQAEGNPGTATPYHGYVFYVQTAEVTGGTLRNYMTHQRLVYGYGLSAVPAAYDMSGKNAFQVNQVGVTYQADRGFSAHLVLFSLTTGAETWMPVE
jgi:prepilin-type N-terminal cleavage/methylation domain-containing protein